MSNIQKSTKSAVLSPLRVKKELKRKIAILAGSEKTVAAWCRDKLIEAAEKEWRDKHESIRTN